MVGVDVTVSSDEINHLKKVKIYKTVNRVNTAEQT